MSGALARNDASRAITRVLGDAVVALLMIAAVLWPPEFGGLRAPSAPSFALLAAGIVTMLLRRRAPRAAASASALITVAAFLIGGPIAAGLIGVLLTVFTVGRLTDRRTTIIAAASVTGVLWGASFVIFGPETTDLQAALLIIASIGFVAAAGDASRSRRAHIEEMTDRARRAEETKEAEALRRVADERVAIARDLHDLVAHQIAVVSLNAGVASRALHDRPEDAERALAIIHDAAHTVLEEISGLLTVLRADDQSGGSARLAPRPGLAQLPELIGQFESGGLTVRRRTEGTPRQLPEAVDAVAYRALQEALTNALKHGRADGTHPASALVQLEYRPGAIVLIVTNPVVGVRAGARDPYRRGHGLNGVRERVASVRGRVDAGPGPGPVYRFTAWLPAPDETQPGARLSELEPRTPTVTAEPSEAAPTATNRSSP